MQTTRPTYATIFRNAIISPYVFPDLGYEVLELDISNLVNIVAEAMDVPPEKIKAKCRLEKVKFARWLVWKLMLSHGYTLSECAKRIGNHHHSSVINAMGKIDYDLETITYLRETWETLKIYMGNKIYTIS